MEIHQSFTCEEQNATKQEQELATKCHLLITKGSSDANLEQIVVALGDQIGQLVGARQDKSISVFIALRTQQCFDKFLKAKLTGRIDQLLRELFIAIGCNKLKLKPSHLEIKDKDIKRASEYLRGKNLLIIGVLHAYKFI